MKKKGSKVKNPIKNLPTLKVWGPIKSMPISCATKAEPQRTDVTTAQISEKDFLSMACTIVNLIKRQAWKQNLFLNICSGKHRI